MTVETSDLPADDVGAQQGPAGLAARPSTVPELTDWLVERVAIYLRRDPAEIDPGEPLAAYGLDSVAALSLCGDVEEDFDLILDPTAAWDHPTATAFAEHIAKELGAAAWRPR